MDIYGWLRLERKKKLWIVKGYIGGMMRGNCSKKPPPLGDDLAHATR